MGKLNKILGKTKENYSNQILMDPISTKLNSEFNEKQTKFDEIFFLNCIKLLISNVCSISLFLEIQVRFRSNSVEQFYISM